jgi:hypothetical protein
MGERLLEVTSREDLPWILHQITAHETAGTPVVIDLRYIVALGARRVSVPLIVPDAVVEVQGNRNGTVPITVRFANNSQPVAPRVLMPRLHRWLSGSDDWTARLAAIPAFVRVETGEPSLKSECADDGLTGTGSGSFLRTFALFVGTLALWVPLYFLWVRSSAARNQLVGGRKGA